MSGRAPRGGLACLALALLACAASAQREVVEFAVDGTRLPIGSSLYVLGDLPELGGGELPRAVKLADTGSGWRVRVSLPVGTEYRFRYWKRAIDPARLADPDNGVPLGDEQTARTQASPGIVAPKKLTVTTSLASPVLHWRQDGVEFAQVRLARGARGRTASEKRYEVAGFASSGRRVEFWLGDGKGKAREPAEGTHATTLDAIWVQDGELFGYEPADRVSPARRDYSPDSPPVVESRILGEKRGYRVMLPRGYDEHASRRYPVLYANDGWLWFDAAADSVDVDGKQLAELVCSGSIGEFLVVGIDHAQRSDTERFFKDRARDYFPAGDWGNTPFGPVEGQNDRYAAFVCSELKPVVDAKYRTLPDREHTWIMGFSAGGVAATCIAWDRDATFGRFGAFAAMYETPRLFARIAHEPRRPLRIYLDSGTVADYYAPTVELYDDLVRRDEPWIVEGDLRLVWGIGHGHTSRDVAQRFQGFLEFLHPAHETRAEPLSGMPHMLEPRAAARALGTALSRSDVEVAFAALRAQGRVGDETVVRAVARGLDHKDARVQEAALVVLRHHPHREALDVLLERRPDWRSKLEPRLAVAYYLALGQHADPRALPVLAPGVVAGEASEVTCARLSAIGRIRTREAVVALVRWLDAERPTDLAASDAAHRALVALTGQRPGDRDRDWVEWWEGAEAGFAPSPVPISVPREFAWLWVAPDDAALFDSITTGARSAPGRGGDR